MGWGAKIADSFGRIASMIYVAKWGAKERGFAISSK
jgi:hypothetical protein